MEGGGQRSKGRVRFMDSSKCVFFIDSRLYCATMRMHVISL